MCCSLSGYNAKSVKLKSQQNITFSAVIIPFMTHSFISKVKHIELKAYDKSLSWEMSPFSLLQEKRWLCIYLYSKKLMLRNAWNHLVIILFFFLLHAAINLNVKSYVHTFLDYWSKVQINFWSNQNQQTCFWTNSFKVRRWSKVWHSLHKAEIEIVGLC